MTTLQSLEQSGQISTLRNSFRVIFFETKSLLNKKLYDMLLVNISTPSFTLDLYEECQTLKKN